MFIFIPMKKHMLLVIAGFICLSFSVVSANNSSPTKKSTVTVIDDLHSTDMSAVLIGKANDLKNNVATFQEFYLDFEQSIYCPDYKMGALKNKVNIIYLFYRVKI